MICWHYCSNDTFLKIIESHSLWLTDSCSMNDSTDCKFIMGLIENYFNATPDTIRRKNLQNFFSLNCQQRRFLSCFSEDGDLLSQWCRYADNGQGVAIGFDFDKLNIPDNRILGGMNDVEIGLSQVIYDTKEQQHIINDLISKHEKMCDDLINKSIQQCDIMQYCQTIIGLSMIFKHYSFSEEKEHRLIYAPRETLAPDGFRQKKDKISPYFKFNFYITTKNGKQILCHDIISEITLGPKNTSCANDIQMFLNMYGYKEVKITKSQIPYVD